MPNLTRSRTFRMAASGLMVVAALALAAILALPYWLNRADVKGQIEIALSDALGAPVRLTEAPALHLLPLPHLYIPSIASIAGPATGLPTGVATGIRLRLTSGPLLRRQAVVEEARVDTLTLRWPGPAGALWLTLTGHDIVAGPLAPGMDGTLTGQLTLAGAAPTLAGTLNLHGTFRPDAAMTAVALPSLQLSGTGLTIGEGQGLAVALTLSGDLDLTRGTLQVTSLDLDSDSLRIQGEAQFSRTAEGRAVTGQLRVAPFDLRDWLERHGYGPGRGASDRLRRVAAASRFNWRQDGDGAALLLDAGQLGVDESRAGFVARLRWPAGDANRAGGGPSGALGLALDQLALDAYLTPAGPASPPAAAATPASGQALTAWQVDALARAPTPPVLPDPAPDAGLRLVARAATLRLGGLRYGGVDLTGHSAGGQVALDATVADLYQGRASAQLRQGDPLDPAHWTLIGNASDVALGALLADTGAAPAAITGRGALSCELTGQGRDADSLGRSLGGEVRLLVTDGTIGGVDLDQMLRLATGGSAAASPGATHFRQLSASAHGSDGRFTTTDIAARAERWHLDGAGHFEVPVQTMDLTLHATLVRPADGSGIRELEGVPIPVTVSGPWARPAWQVDASTALAEVARRALQQRGGKALNDLEQQLGIPGLRKGLEQGLRGLFGH